MRFPPTTTTQTTCWSQEREHDSNSLANGNHSKRRKPNICCCTLMVRDRDAVHLPLFSVPRHIIRPKPRNETYSFFFWFVNASCHLWVRREKERESTHTTQTHHSSTVPFCSPPSSSARHFFFVCFSLLAVEKAMKDTANKKKTYQERR